MKVRTFIIAFFLTALAVAGKGGRFAKLVDRIPPASQLPGTDAQLLTDQGIGHTRFIGPLQGLSFKLCAVALPSCHDTPPSTLSCLYRWSVKPVPDQLAVLGSPPIAPKDGAPTACLVRSWPESEVRDRAEGRRSYIFQRPVLVVCPKPVPGHRRIRLSSVRSPVYPTLSDGFEKARGCSNGLHACAGASGGLITSRRSDIGLFECKDHHSKPRLQSTLIC